MVGKCFGQVYSVGMKYYDTRKVRVITNAA